MGDESEVKKAKGTKECVIKRELMFENYNDCFFVQWQGYIKIKTKI